MKKFTIVELRDLFNRVMIGDISFPEMVEIMNERMEEMNEPQYKDGDFVINMAGDILIFKKKIGCLIYDHAYLTRSLRLFIHPDEESTTRIDRYTTEAEKQELLDALAKKGKRWNAEKLCVENIPQPKFKKGDKVRIKEGVSSKTHNDIYPGFIDDMDDLIGKTMTVDKYTNWDNYVICEETYWSFLEDWLEPYVEDIPKRKFKKGDKVVLKSGYKKSDGLIYLDVFDLFIGKPLTIKGYADVGCVFFSDCPYIFDEDWLEPWIDELKKGDLAIFWDNGDKGYAIISLYDKKGHEYHYDDSGVTWENAIKFESKEQYKRLIKGEI